MKKSTYFRFNLLIGLLILIGFITMSFVNYNTYSKIIEDDIENITKLTSTNVYSEINNELVKPIFVSLTMANDSFLKEWLREEKIKGDGYPNFLYELQEYLLGIKQKYDYSSVFLVSDTTSNYYNYLGILKKVSKNNEHDSWYYNFVDQAITYDLDVDYDEADDGKLTVFVNCQILDENKELLGVTGVGVEMNEVQEILSKFERDYHVEAFLIDGKGLVQVHTKSSLIEENNIFDDLSITQYKSDILNNKSTMGTYQIEVGSANEYLISRYIDELDWYIIVKKDTSILLNSFKAQLWKDLLILLFVFGGVLVASNALIERFKKQILSMAKTDQLTQLNNRRGFDEMLKKAIGNFEEDNQSFYIFVLDIDDFKLINDRYGHIYGDHVIKSIASFAQTYVRRHGDIARWGGDEFAGILYGTSKEVQFIIQKLIDDIRVSDQFIEHPISVSIGLTEMDHGDSAELLIARADKALYMAKEKGKGQMVSLK